MCSVLPSAGRIQSSSNTSGLLGVDATLLPLVSSLWNSQPDPNLVRSDWRPSGTAGGPGLACLGLIQMHVTWI